MVEGGEIEKKMAYMSCKSDGLNCSLEWKARKTV
jgi:hypothetical protein